MIVAFLLNALFFLLDAVFSPLPTVSILPAIGGYDIDSSLVSGVGLMYRFFEVVWPLAVVFQGFLVLMGYYGGKLVLKMLLGSRVPGSH